MRDRGEQVELHPLLTWILNGGDWAASRHAQFTSVLIGYKYGIALASQVRMNIKLLLQAAFYF